MNRVNVEAVQPNSVSVESTGIGFIGEPKRKKEYSPTPSLHPSVVDAWVFSGYSNDNPPDGIRGVKGNVLTPNGFAWSGSSGFGKYATNFKKDWDVSGSFGEILSSTKAQAIVKSSTPQYIVRCTNIDLITSDSFQIRVKGISNSGFELTAGYDVQLFTIGGVDGTYTINKSDIVASPVAKDFGFKIKAKSGETQTETKVEIELVPQYGGSIVLDGVTDYLLLDKLNYKIGTVLIGTSFIEPKTTGLSYLFNTDEVRTYLAYENGAMIASANSIAKSGVNGNIEATYNVSDITQPLYIGHSGVGDNYLKFGLRYIAPYGAILTAEEKIEERIKLEEMWRKRNV